MRIDKIRIQNFQCIRGSGDVIPDEHITILIGENESGKSVILRGLSSFNKDECFKDVDVSTIAGNISRAP